jgi:hypothetical protein
MRISVSTSSASSAVVNTAVKNCFTGMVRAPFGPVATTSAPIASIVAG